jgi:ComF family protein
MRVVRAICEAVIELVAPRECAACDSTPVNDLWLCPTCSHSLVSTHGATERISGVPLIAPLVYTGAVVDAVHRLKYGNRPDLARPLAMLVLRALRVAALPEAESAAWFVPVPLHPRRLAERGYNQSALLARHLARTSKARVLPMLLRRTRDTPQQAMLSGAERGHNVRDAFEVRSRRTHGERRLIVVDDVVTTGATAVQCIEALRDAGASPIAVVAVARVGQSARGGDRT